MKFLIDAQLPRRLAYWLSEIGHDVVHTSELPWGNRTDDSHILDLSLREQRIVVTKDADFVDSLILRQSPHKLLLISTGNIRNTELLELFNKNIEGIERVLETCTFAELNQDRLIVHD
ncbi:MAG: DUF5615 family PIN-like protein [Gammaproteobacteria bacterium]|nr:DUF5615 family PIN-like protein [Gammaproteobacteria bacterium]